MTKMLLAVLVVATLFVVAAPAQDAAEIPAGTIIPVELSKSLDARKAKVGDPIECKLPADVLLHGKIVIPRETRIVGHITDVKAPSKETPGASLGIAFDSMVMKKAEETAIHVILQAVGRPLSLVDSPAHRNEVGDPSAGGAGRTTANPSRMEERVAAIPLDAAGMNRDTPPPTTMAPLGPTSKGVVGMKGLSLDTSGQAPVIRSESGNVHLDGGTQMILRTQ